MGKDEIDNKKTFQFLHEETHAQCEVSEVDDLIKEICKFSAHFFTALRRFNLKGF